MTKKQNSKKHYGRLILEIILLLVWVGASIIASQYLVGFIIVWTMGVEAFDRPDVTAVFSAVSYSIAMMLIIFVPPIVQQFRSKKRTKEYKPASREEFGLKGLPTWTDIGLAPIGFVVYYILSTVLMYLFQFFPWFNINETQDVGFSPYLVGPERLVAFITLVIVAPIAEEIIFRGWLYKKLKTRLSKEISNTISIIVSSFLVSLLFGLIHRQWSVGVDVFAMSLVLCGLREITGTIYAGLLLHILKNGLAFYFLFVAGMGL